MALRLWTLATIAIFLSMFVLGLGGFLTEADKVYNRNLTETEFSSLVIIAEISNITTISGKPVLSAGIQESDSLTTFVKAGFSGAKVIAGLPFLLQSMVFDSFNFVAAPLGLNPKFGDAIIALIFIVATSALSYAIFKIRY